MKKILIGLWILLGWGIFAQAQIITITDNQSEKPLEMVTLSSETLKAFTTTNAEGQADISALKDAEKIQIRLLGYKTLVKSYSEIQDADFKIQMEFTKINLDQVVVSATRWRQESDEVPAKIATISATEVAFQNPQTAADLLSVSGQVYVQKKSARRW